MVAGLGRSVFDVLCIPEMLCIGDARRQSMHGELPAS